MATINVKEREIKVDREVAAFKRLKLYKDREEELRRWSVEVKVRQVVKIDNEVADDIVYYSEKYDSQIAEISAEEISKVVDQLASELIERINDRYETINKLIEIAKKLELDIIIDRY